jgi:hypothetical protein
MSKKKMTLSLCFSLFLFSSTLAPSLFAASVETVGDLKVDGQIESTGGFKFSDGATLSGAGDITANSSFAAFQVTQQGSGHGIDATSMSGDAVHASAQNNGIYGESHLATGILGFTYASGNSNAGVVGSTQGSANGVWGQSTSGNGVRGSSSSGDAIHGESTSSTGVYGQSGSSVGVLGYTGASGTPNAGVRGLSHSDAYGVAGDNTSTGIGVYGDNSGTGYGVYGYASGSAQAAGRFVSSATNGIALVAESPSGTQVMKTDATGIHAGPGMTGTPLAYGFFLQNALKQVGSSNLDCSWVTSRYECTITGQNYVWWQYVTNITPSGGFAVPAADSGNNKLLITFYDKNGSTIQPSGGFAVTIYKP